MGRHANVFITTNFGAIDSYWMLASAFTRSSYELDIHFGRYAKWPSTSQACHHWQFSSSRSCHSSTAIYQIGFELIHPAAVATPSSSTSMFASHWKRRWPLQFRTLSLTSPSETRDDIWTKVQFPAVKTEWCAQCFVLLRLHVHPTSLNPKINVPYDLARCKMFRQTQKPQRMAGSLTMMMTHRRLWRACRLLESKSNFWVRYWKSDMEMGQNFLI